MIDRLKSFVLVTFLLCSCSREHECEETEAPAVTSHAVGEWNNIYKGSSDLAGIRVQQFPDCDGDAYRYEGKHPAMVIYVFRNNRARQVGYEPDGTVHEDFWWDIPKGDCIWDNLDIRYDIHK